MKWIIGGLLLAVVGSVYSGRVPMTWVIYCFAALFASLGAALVFAYTRSKHPGLLLMGITYFVSALASVVLEHWWPLLAGFAALWAFRAMGMEPTAEFPKPADAAANDSEKKV